MKRGALVLSIVALASFGLVTPVLAAAPGNDSYSGRTVIPATPFSDSVDTTEATTDADDAEANAACGAPVTDASVWYEHTPAADAELIVEALDSDYPVGIIVATGAPGGLSLVTCGAGGTAFTGFAGETYAILLFDFQGDDGGNGGLLSWRLRELPPPPPPPDLALTVSPFGSFVASTGAAVVRGTVTCTGGDESSKTFIDVQASQIVGRFRLHGQGFTTFACDGGSHPWEAEVFSDDGKFGGGKASVRVFAFVCNEGGCDEVEVLATITLRS